MNKLLWKILVFSVSLYLMKYILNGIMIDSITSAILAGILLSLLYVTIRPLLMVVCLPLNLMSFGLFILIINTWMLQLTDLMVGGFCIQDFKDAITAAIIITVINHLLYPHQWLKNTKTA